MTTLMIDTVTCQEAPSELETLYREHLPQAVRFAYLLTGNSATAEDIAHDAFMRAASRRMSLTSGHFNAYLRRTVVRCVLMQHRSASREQRRTERAMSLRPTSQDGSFAATVAQRVDLFESLRSLPPRQRAAIVLRYWDDLPETEIAQILGCRLGTVKSTLSRALESLRKVMNDAES